MPPTAVQRLDHLRVLRVSGADRVALLQGQSSNDVRRVDPMHAQLTSFNTPKGRCLAIALLVAWDDAHYLVVERDIAESLCKRLRMYILRSKAVVEPAGDRAVLGRFVAEDASEPAFRARREGDSVAVSLPGARELRLAPAPQGDALAADEAAWRRADIAAGLATVLPATAEHFVPLWLGLERHGAIDYQKGCYTGQEIVARTHWLGVQKQHLHRARASRAAEPGAKVLGPEGQAVGEVVISAPEGDGHALLMVAREAASHALDPGAPLSGVERFG